VRANSTLGIPAMWALAADYTASATTYVGRGMQEESRALELARQLSAKQSPLRRKRDFIHIEESGLSYDLVDRVSCCLYFQVEDGHYCSSCPHRSQEERVKLIQDWLAKSAAEQTEVS
jgi:ferric iron reductase protein FhuF